MTGRDVVEGEKQDWYRSWCGEKGYWKTNTRS